MTSANNPNPTTTRNESTSASSGIRSASHHGVGNGIGSGGVVGIGSHPHHPGTSGRSPPPSRMSSSSLAGGGGGGRLSIGSTSTTSGVSIPSSSSTAANVNVGRPSSFDQGSGMRLPPAAAAAAAAAAVGRSSSGGSGGGIGMMISGTRLSYGGGSSSGSGGPSSSAADDAAGILNTRTPAPYYNQQQQLRSLALASPPSTSSTTHGEDYVTTTNNPYSPSDFLAVLSPSTANFLRRNRGESGGEDSIHPGGLTIIGVEPRVVGMEAAVTATTNNKVLSPASAASLAAENAVRTAANAARGIDHKDDTNEDKDIDMTDEDETAADEFNFDATRDGGRKNQNNHPTNDNDKGNKYSNSIDKDDSSQLRQFVQSLLGMQLPASFSDNSNTSASMMQNNMITPDPTSAAFFAISLLTKTAYSSSSTSTDTNMDGSIGGEGRMADRLKPNWRPDDAYLAARALSLGGEDKRAIYILDKVGLIGFGMEGAGSGGGGGGGVVGVDGGEEDIGRQSATTTSTTPPISNRRGVQNALLLRAESALLAGQCLIRAGDYERASMVYEEGKSLHSYSSTELYLVFYSGLI